MRSLYFLTSLLIVLSFSASGQDKGSPETILTGAEARNEIEGTNKLRYKAFSQVPAFIKFDNQSNLTLETWEKWILNHYFKENDNISFKLIGQEEDQLGMIHYRYRQVSQSYPLEFGVWIVHTSNGRVVSMNGELFDAVPEFTPSLSEQSALNYALISVGATTYKWDVPAEEAYLKVEQNDPNATYFPTGELVIVNEDPTLAAVNLHLAWKFNIYAHEPMSRAEIFVSAETGSIIFENNEIHHADSTGTAITAYSGTQTITTDFTGSLFRLRENGRGDGITTLNLNLNTSGPSDFTDNNNYWSLTNVEQYGTDGHYGAEMTYDFFYNNFGRNSIDNNGFELVSWVNYDNGYSNAFWNGQRMTYGAGAGNNSSFATMDIAGHEISHGLTNFTADLNYSYESGALNESFSDIFGAAIEFYAEGFSNGDWTMGEDRGSIIRFMNNPNNGGDPDTYLGTYWWTSPGDNGGVHTNSGVQNFWFYLLTQGGTGTNDNGDSYFVTSIGINDAQAIAFRNLTVYLTSTSQYADARFYALESATDLFGVCTQQLESTADAWHAVGIGSAFSSVVTADFSADIPESCNLPHTVNFSNLSSNTSTYLWNFGDGNTSTSTTPSHQYTQGGTYTVSLQASSACGSDTKTEVNYILVGPEAPCSYTLPASGEGITQQNCSGYLYDNGGPSGSYLPNTDSYVTLEPCGASSVTIYFDEFNLEGGSNCPYDYLTVYDGPNLSSPILGQYCGSNLPPSSLTSTGSSMTIRMQADGGLEYSGFKISWECEEGTVTTPIPDFSASDLETCDGTITFFDDSENCPDSLFWNFGDGHTSIDHNPTHHYALNGQYDVTLYASSSNGTDSITKPAYITVERPEGPTVANTEICPGDAATLHAISATQDDIYWYDDVLSQTAIHVGDSFTTPIVSSSTPYFVQSFLPSGSIEYGGPNDNSIGSGSNFSANQHLVFDATMGFILRQVKVFANGAGNRTIELRDNSGNVLESATVNIPNGESVVDIDFIVSPGTDLELGLSSGSDVNLYRNNSGTNYPYDINGLGSIKRSSANQNGGLDHYYYFYNWKVEALCATERMTIVASTGECTGVNEVDPNAFHLFPNPNNGSFNLTWSGYNVEAISLFDNKGQLIQTNYPVNQGNYDATLNLAKGVYHLVVKTEQTTISKKVVIQ